MQGKKLRHLCVAALVTLAVISLSSSAHAYPNGISGVSGKSGSTCTMCHSTGSAVPTVIISGPTTVTSGSTNTYTLSNNGTPNSGLDVAATQGTFTAGSTTQVMNSEITHLAALTITPLSWTFSWTAPTVTSTTTVTMYGASISGGFGGSTGSTSLVITVNPPAVAPSISMQPANQTVTAGQTATFSVTAAGTAPLSYQWRKNGANISGASSSSYTTPATTTADSGSTFSVVVSNSAGSVTSNNATLTVNAAAVAPSIAMQPANQTVTAGQTATFSVTAAGTAPLSYQWRKNGANISGASSSSYTTPATTTADSGSTFSVVVSNSVGSVTSNNATLTVSAAPPPSSGATVLVSPSRLVFYAEGSTTPAPKTIVVSSNTGSALNFTAEVYGGSWLSVNPSAGTTRAKLTASAYATGLTAGTYSCVVKITANGITKRVAVVLVVAAGNDGAESSDSLVLPFTFDPGGQRMANAAWTDGSGVPFPSKTDPTNQGLVLAKSTSGPPTAIAGAAFKGAAGSQLTQLGFDLRSGSECSAHAPQFVVITADEVVHTANCADGNVQSLSVAGWKRVSFDPTNSKQLSPAVPTGTAVKTVALVMDQTVGTGIAVLDNINVNGTFIGKQ
jgi:hypothetical protein